MKTGIGWYTKDTYHQLLECADDRDNLDDVYEDWLKNYKRLVKHLRKSGIKTEPVAIDIVKLVQWCKDRDLPNNGNSRSRYVSFIMTKRGGNNPFLPV